jgi:hypothetical protein
LLLETGLEGEFTGTDNQLAHRSLLLDAATRTWFSRIHYSRNKRKQGRFRLHPAVSAGAAEPVIRPAPRREAARRMSFELSTRNPGARRAMIERSITSALSSRKNGEPMAAGLERESDA